MTPGSAKQHASRKKGAVGETADLFAESVPACAGLLQVILQGPSAGAVACVVDQGLAGRVDVLKLRLQGLDLLLLENLWRDIKRTNASSQYLGS